MNLSSTHSEDDELDRLFNDIRLKEINRFSISSKPIRKLSSCLSKPEDLMRYLSKFGSLSDELWEDLRYAILYDIEFGRLQDILEELDRVGINFKSRNDIDQFMKYYMQAVNHTRIWRNNSHTPVEIRELYTENVRVPLKKFGRNEPCPCGSGKKYKKCCGAN